MSIRRKIFNNILEALKSAKSPPKSQDMIIEWNVNNYLFKGKINISNKVKKTKIFYDVEATSLSRDCDPISIGLIAVTTTKKSITVDQYLEIINKEFNLELSYDAELNTYLEENLSPIKSEFLRQESYGIHINYTYKLNEYFIKVSIIDSMHKDSIVKNMNIWKEEVDTKSFYGEFTDFNEQKTDTWVKENVISKLFIDTEQQEKAIDFSFYNDVTLFKGSTAVVSNNLKHWLSKFDNVEFWADYDTIDKPILVDLISNWEYNVIQHWGESSPPVLLGETKYKIGIPKHLPNIKYYNFYDIHTLFNIKGIDPDISREEFVKEDLYSIPSGFKDTALYDSYVSMLCYNKLINL